MLVTEPNMGNTFKSLYVILSQTPRCKSKWVQKRLGAQICSSFDGSSLSLFLWSNPGLVFVVYSHETKGCRSLTKELLWWWKRSPCIHAVLGCLSPLMAMPPVECPKLSNHALWNVGSHHTARRGQAFWCHPSHGPWPRPSPSQVPSSCPERTLVKARLQRLNGKGLEWFWPILSYEWFMPTIVHDSESYQQASGMIPLNYHPTKNRTPNHLTLKFVQRFFALFPGNTRIIGHIAHHTMERLQWGDFTFATHWRLHGLIRIHGMIITAGVLRSNAVAANWQRLGWIK